MTGLFISAFVAFIVFAGCAYFAVVGFNANDVNLGIMSIIAALGWFLVGAGVVGRMSR